MTRPPLPPHRRRRRVRVAAAFAILAAGSGFAPVVAARQGTPAEQPVVIPPDAISDAERAVGLGRRSLDRVRRHRRRPPHGVAHRSCQQPDHRPVAVARGRPQWRHGQPASVGRRLRRRRRSPRSPYDLFRDDDRDLRWDVYRLVVPECGGQVNGWELVSTADSTGIARDDVLDRVAPHAVRFGRRDRLRAPGARRTRRRLDDHRRRHHGADQRAGTHADRSPACHRKPRAARTCTAARATRRSRRTAVTWRSSATPPRPMRCPVGARAPFPAAYATSQVFVWDRGAADQRRAVRLISGRDGVPSAAGAGEPAMSEDGRIVVFTSRDRTLVPAELQLHRRVPDADLPVRPRHRPQRHLRRAGPPATAGDRVRDRRRRRRGRACRWRATGPSWAPAVNADGSSIAFVTDATNLLPSRRGGGGEAIDGDLLVAEFQLGQIRRVLDGARHHRGAGRPRQSCAVEDRRGDGVRHDGGGSDRASHTAHQRWWPCGGHGRSHPAAVARRARLRHGDARFREHRAVRDRAQRRSGGVRAARTSPRRRRTSRSPAGRASAGSSSPPGRRARSSSRSTRAKTARVRRPSCRCAAAGRERRRWWPTLRGAAGEPALLATRAASTSPTASSARSATARRSTSSNIGFVPTSVRSITIGGAYPDDFRIVSEACTRRALNPDAKLRGRGRVPPARCRLSQRAPRRHRRESGAYTTAVLGGFARYEPEFLKAEDSTVRPGEAFGVGGSGFPAELDAVDRVRRRRRAVRHRTRPAPTARSSPAITVPARLRIGPRVLVASAPGGVIASLHDRACSAASESPPPMRARLRHGVNRRRQASTGMSTPPSSTAISQPVPVGSPAASHVTDSTMLSVGSNGNARDARLELVGAVHRRQVPLVEHVAVAQQLGGAEVAVRVLEHECRSAERAVGRHRDRLAALSG